MSKRIILLSFFICFLSACSSISLQPSAPKKLLLLPPSEGPYTSVLKQKVTMDTHAGQHQFIVVIRVEITQLKLRALLATGQPILSIDYNGHTLKQNNVSSIALPSEDILAMIQFALWPIDSLNKHYSRDNGWQLDVGPKQRLLQTIEGKVLSVDYLSSEELLVENYQHDYRVRIEMLETQAL